MDEEIRQEGEVPGTEEEIKVKRKRPIYEPTLFEDKKRIKVPRAVSIPIFIIVFGAGLYLLVIAPKLRRIYDTAGKIVVSVDTKHTGEAQLFLENSDGTVPVLISPLPAKGSDLSPAFAPDGNQIAFVSTRDGLIRQLYVVDPNGTNRTQITRTVGVKGSPAFCPSDINTIGYTDAGVLECVNAATMAVDRLLPRAEKKQNSADSITSTASSKAIVSFAWAPCKDQSKQAVAGIEETNGEDRLVVLPDPESESVESTDGTVLGPPLIQAQELSLCWLPDGVTIAVAALGVDGMPGGNKFSGVVFFNKNGQGINRSPLFGIANDQTGPQGPIAFPDGSHIISQRWHQPDIATTTKIGLAIAPIDGSSQPKVILSGNLEDQKFSADGQFLYFTQGRPDGGHDLMRADLTKKIVTRISNGVDDVLGYDLSPQGKH